MIEKAIIATTHLGKDNVKLTRAALEDMASDINNGPLAIPVLLDHDLSILPLGKSLRAEIESTGDGEYQLVCTHEIFDAFATVRMPDGAIGYRYASTTDFRPYKTIKATEALQISYSPHGFATQQDIDTFSADISRTLGSVEVKPVFRRSLLPDPELLLIFPLWFSLKLANKTADKLADQLSDSLVSFLTNVCSAIQSGTKTYALNMSNRLVTYVFTVEGNPRMELVAKLTKPGPLITALTLDNLLLANKRAVALKDLLGAKMVQFILINSGEWEFNYLTTHDGAVIGSPASYSRRTERLELMLNPSATAEPFEPPEVS